MFIVPDFTMKITLSREFLTFSTIINILKELAISGVNSEDTLNHFKQRLLYSFNNNAAKIFKLDNNCLGPKQFSSVLAEGFA